MDHPTGLVICTNEAYHSGPGVSKSHLDDIAPELDMTPLHYWHRHLNPDFVREDDTEATRFGTAVHTALLEPDLLSNTVVRGLDLARRSTADKYAHAEFEQRHEGKLILKPDEYDRVYQLRDRVMKHPFLSPILRRGKAEQSFYAIDKETGLLVKCRPDYTADNWEFTVDVKSTDRASTRAFGNSIAKYRYDVQPPFYEDILDNLYGEHPPTWIFAVVEKTPPYACNVIYATAEMRAVGRAKARRDLRLIAECKARNYWPDFAVDFNPAELPAWYVRALS